MSKNIYIDYLAEQPGSNNHYLNRLLKILRYSTEKEVSHQIGYEEHHIVPKSWKPEWKRVKDNMIYLPTRLHFIIHWLRVANGTHHLLGTMSAFNINTKEIKRIPKEEFYSNSDIWVSSFKKSDYITY